jgi:riboflavin kinase/FMN adenylyltransferase
MPNLGRAVACIGKFDGVHVGHRRLIAETVSRARAAAVSSVVVTFDRHPACVLAPGAVPVRISPLETNLALIGEMAPDYIVVLEFSERLAAMAGERFLDRVLLNMIEPVEIIVGAGFRFGAGATCDAAMMRHHLALQGCAVAELPLVEVGRMPAASSRVRELIESGAVAIAAGLLGRVHMTGGEAVAVEAAPHDGCDAGRLVRLPADIARPRAGRYSCVMRTGGQEFASAVAPVPHWPSSAAALVERWPKDLGPLPGPVQILWLDRMAGADLRG